MDNDGGKGVLCSAVPADQRSPEFRDPVLICWNSLMCQEWRPGCKNL